MAGCNYMNDGKESIPTTAQSGEGASNSSQVHRLEDTFHFSADKTRRHQLHKHAGLLLSQASFESPSLEAGQFSATGFFWSLLAAPFYQRVVSVYGSVPGSKMRGPFMTTSLSPADYQPVSEDDFVERIGQMLQQERWMSPPLTEEQTDRLKILIGYLIDQRTRIFRLRRCEDFNRMHRQKRVPDNPQETYDHEWSHALLEYHEYVLIDWHRQKVQVLSFAYD